MPLMRRSLTRVCWSVLTNCVGDMKDMVEEAERSSAFRSSLAEVVRDHT